MYNSAMIVRANAKVNLFLKVHEKSGDKHPIESIFFPLYDLYDTIEIEKAEKTTCTTFGANITQEENLCYKIAREFGNFKIVINKKIPLGAGLGGGSSDAATVLLAINELLDFKLSKEELVKIASSFGSDIPFFIYNIPCKVAGFGEIVTPIRYEKFGMKLILYTNKYHSSTKAVYDEFDRGRINFNWVESSDLTDYSLNLYNSLQAPCFSLYPEIKKLYDAVDAPYKLLSGSGSSFFTLSKNEVKPFEHEELIAYEFPI